LEGSLTENCAHRQTRKGSTIAGRCMSHISIAYHPATVADWCNVGRVTIDMLPDVALLEIFDCYVRGPEIDDEYTAKA